MLNKIICGDCLVEMSKIPDKYVDMILTDIPYDGVNRSDNGLRNLDKKDADFLEFDLHKFLGQCLRVCKGSIYIFCGFGQISLIHSVFEASGLSSRLLIWEKTNPSPMNGDFVWLSGIEPCVFGKFSGAPFNGHCRNTVLRFPTGNFETEHPTEKNFKLFCDLIQVSTDPGMLVLDPCNGSGTTTKAAQYLNRKFIGIDKSSEYCSMAEQRLKQQVMNF